MFGVRDSVLGFRIWGLRLNVQLGFAIWSLGFRVSGSIRGFWVSGLEFGY